MCHGTNPKYLQFLNIIQEKKPTTKEIQKVFSLCFLEIQEIDFHINRTTTILCTQNQCGKIKHHCFTKTFSNFGNL